MPLHAGTNSLQFQIWESQTILFVLFSFPDLLRKNLLDEDLGWGVQVETESPLNKKILDSKTILFISVKSLMKGLATICHATLTIVCTATRGLFNKAS